MLLPWQPIQTGFIQSVNIDVAVPGRNLTLNSLVFRLHYSFQSAVHVVQNGLFPIPICQFPFCQFPFGQLPKWERAGFTDTA